MSPAAQSLVARLTAAGIHLRVEPGDRLRYRAPKGALTAAFAAEIKALRGELIASLQEISAIRDDTIEPLPDAPHYALSQAQWRLWILMQLQRDSIAYNVPLHLAFHGELDARLVERVFTELIQRHEALRTNFVVCDDHPRQVVHAPAALSIPVTDISSAPDPAARARTLGREQTAAPFDLAHDALMRVALLRLGPARHVLLMTLHHIVIDGTSFGILLREFGQIYAAFQAGLPSPLPPLTLHYRDYAAWQNTRLHHPSLQPHGAYWRQQFTGEIPVLELPADHPRPTVLTHHGAEITFVWDAPMAARFAEYCQRGRATLFMGLLAAVKLLLHRHTGQTDLIVGSPVAGRSQPELADQVGFYINTLALRTRIDPQADARELLAQVRATVTAAFDHQDYPFDFLVNELDLKRDQSRSPLFDVMVTLQNQDESGSAVADLSVRSFIEPSQTSKVDLTFYFKQTDAGLSGAIEFNTDIYAPDRIERMAGHLAQLVTALPRAGTEPVAALDLLSAAERDQILHHFNPAPPPPSSLDTLITRFEATVVRTPQAIAVSLPDGAALSYTDLNQRANRLAAQLTAAGVSPDDPVGLFFERSVELIVAMVAVLKAGGAYLPIDPVYPDERVAFILQDAQTPVVLTQPSLRERLPSTAGKIISVTNDGVSPPPHPNPPPIARPESAAYIIYTSGSTGSPKGCVIPHAQVVRLFDATQAWFEFDAQDVWTMFHSPAFDFSVWEIWGALLFGGRLVIVPHDTSRDPGALLNLLREERVTILNQTPSAFQQLSTAETMADSADSGLALRKVIFGGEALDPGHLRAWWDRHGDQMPQLVNMYGITETTVHVTYRPLSKSDLAMAGRSLIGAPIPDLTVYLLDAHGGIVPVGVPGEIHIGGRGLARGYLNRPELTAQRFIPDPFSPATDARLYRSGDLARWLPNGELEYLGRADQQVKVRGFRIELGEIEIKLRHHPAVAHAQVLARTDASADTQLVAYLTATDPPSPPTADLLRGHLALHLPDYMIPTAFVVLDTMPLTANGKLDRRALPAPEIGSPDDSRNRVAPRSPTEQAWAGIWSEVLGLPDVGVTDSFFDLGGHSLKAVRIVARARQELGSAVTIADVFSHPTIAGLARLDETSPPPSAPAVLPRESTEATLSIAQRRLWILEQMHPGTPAFNISNAWQIVGALDHDRLADALRTIVRRHAALRTVFVDDGDVIKPVIKSAKAFALEHRDVGSAVQPESAASAIVADLAATPFDLVRGPLFRALRIRVSDTKNILVLTMHHLVSDGWSMELILRELGARYARPDTDLPVAGSYQHFARIRNREIAGENGTAWRDYWQRTLSRDAEVLNLPTDFTRPAVMETAGRVTEIRFDPATTRALKTLAATEHCTVFMGLVALVKTLLHRYTGQTDINVGTPVAGRDRTEWEHTVGFFINTIVLRDEIDPDGDVRALLRGVRETCLSAFAHQNYPFDQLVDDLGTERDLSRHPIFDVSIQHAPRDAPAPAWAGLAVSAYAHDQIPLKCDLSFDFSEDDTGLVCGLTYNPALFTADRIDRLSGHLRQLARAMGTTPDAPIRELPLLDATERALVVETFARGPDQAAATISLSRWFDDQAGRHAEDPALLFDDRSVSYAQLQAHVDRLAQHLTTNGVRPGQVVGVMMERGFGLPVAMLAIMRARAIYLPLDPALPAARIALLIEDADVTLVVTDAAMTSRCPSGAMKVIWDQTEPGTAPPGELPYPQPDDPAYLIYTSGSTGTPKGVLVSHGAYANTARNQHDLLGLKPGDRTLQFANSSFDASIFEILGTLLSGAALIFAPTAQLTDPTGLPEFLRTHQVTVAVLPPSFLRTLNKAELPLRVLLTAGEAAVPEDLHHYASRLTCINAYGPTEAAVCNALEVVSADKTSDDHSAPIPIGRPLAGTQLYLLDADRKPVPIGVDGELFIGGHGLAIGYWRQPDLSHAAFVANPFSDNPQDRLYRTGDIGRWLPDGRVVFVGRRDGQIKLRGHRIETGEIAHAIQAHPAVQAAVVMLRRDRPDHPLLCAYFRPVDPSVEINPVREAIAAQLPGYMLPEAWIALASWPTTAAGKIDRRALPAPDLTSEAPSFVAPRDKVERIIASIFQEILALDQIGVHDRFFRLGGNSLLAVRAVTRIRDALRVELPVTEFFAHASVGELAAALRRSPAARARVDQVAAARLKLAAMSPAQKQALLAAQRTRSSAG